MPCIFLVLLLPSEWAGYGDFRQVAGVTSTPTYVIVASPTSLLTYDKFRDRWSPICTERELPYGISGVVADPNTYNLWFATPSVLGRLNLKTGYWITYPLPMTGTIENMGIDGDQIYLLISGRGWVFNKRNYTWDTVYPGVEIRWELSPPEDYPILTPYWVMDKYANLHAYLWVYEDDLYVWVGVEHYGLMRYHKYKGEEKYYCWGAEGSCSGVILDDKIWIAGNKDGELYLMSFDIHGKSKYYYPEKELMVEFGSPLSLQTSSHQIYIATQHGVIGFDPARETWYRIRLPWGFTRYVIATYGDTLWVGTSTRLARFHDGIKLKEWRWQLHPITALLATDDGLWIGTTGSLYLLRDTLLVEVRDTQENFPTGVDLLKPWGKRIIVVEHNTGRLGIWGHNSWQYLHFMPPIVDVEPKSDTIFVGSRYQIFTYPHTMWETDFSLFFNPNNTGIRDIIVHHDTVILLTPHALYMYPVPK